MHIPEGAQNNLRLHAGSCSVSPQDGRWLAYLSIFWKVCGSSDKTFELKQPVILFLEAPAD
jgi:hypothetical protein